MCDSYNEIGTYTFSTNNVPYDGTVVDDQVGNDFTFKPLVAGNGILIDETSNPGAVTVIYTGVSGAPYTYSTIVDPDADATVVSTAVGQDFRFKGLKEGTNILLDDTTNPNVVEINGPTYSTPIIASTEAITDTQVANDFRFKPLKAGNSMSLDTVTTPGAITIVGPTYSTPVIVGSIALTNTQVVNDFRFKPISGGTNITLDEVTLAGAVTINGPTYSTAPIASTVPITTTQVANDFRFKPLKAGTNIVLDTVTTAGAITIDGPTYSTPVIASTVTVTNTQVGNDFRFKPLKAGTNLLLDEITTPGAITLNAPTYSTPVIAGTTSITGLQVANDFRFKPLNPGTNITIDEVTVAGAVTINGPTYSTPVIATTVPITNTQVANDFRFKPLKAGTNILLDTVTTAGAITIVGPTYSTPVIPGTITVTNTQVVNDFRFKPLGSGTGITLDEVTTPGVITINATPVAASILQNNLIYVDAQYGNNGTGIRESLTLPFLTIQAALVVAISGDTIVVLPGTYTANIILPNGVNMYLYSGATLTTTVGTLFTCGVGNVNSIFGQGILSTAVGIATSAGTLTIECASFVSAAGTAFTSTAGILNVKAFSGTSASGVNNNLGMFVTSGTGSILAKVDNISATGLVISCAASVNIVLESKVITSNYGIIYASGTTGKVLLTADVVTKSAGAINAITLIDTSGANSNKSTILVTANIGEFNVTTTGVLACSSTKIEQFSVNDIYPTIILNVGNITANIPNDRCFRSTLGTIVINSVNIFITSADALSGGVSTDNGVLILDVKKRLECTNAALFGNTFSYNPLTYATINYLELPGIVIGGVWKCDSVVRIDDMARFTYGVVDINNLTATVGSGSLFSVGIGQTMTAKINNLVDSTLSTYMIVDDTGILNLTTDSFVLTGTTIGLSSATANGAIHITGGYISGLRSMVTCPMYIDIDIVDPGTSTDIFQCPQLVGTIGEILPVTANGVIFDTAVKDVKVGKLTISGVVTVASVICSSGLSKLTIGELVHTSTGIFMLALGGNAILNVDNLTASNLGTTNFLRAQAKWISCNIKKATLSGAGTQAFIGLTVSGEVDLKSEYILATGTFASIINNANSILATSNIGIKYANLTMPLLVSTGTFETYIQCEKLISTASIITSSASIILEFGGSYRTSAAAIFVNTSAGTDVLSLLPSKLVSAGPDIMTSVNLRTVYTAPSVANFGVNAGQITIDPIANLTISAAMP